MSDAPLKAVPKKVIPFDGVTRLNLPAQRVLDAANDSDLEDVVILGKQADGEYYFASSVTDGGTVLWMMEKLKKVLLEV